MRKTTGTLGTFFKWSILIFISRIFMQYKYAIRIVSKPIIGRERMKERERERKREREREKERES